MFTVKHLGRTAGLQLALKLVFDSDPPGERQGVETTVEQALMRGLATA
jgi:hypothetical protein